MEVTNWRLLFGVAAFGAASTAMYYLGYRNGQKSINGASCNPQSVIPIDDLKDGQYTEEEKEARCKLAAFYRVIDLLDWTDRIYNHISVSIYIYIYI